MGFNFVTQDKRLIPIYHEYNASQEYQGFVKKTIYGSVTFTLQNKKGVKGVFYYLPDNTQFATVASCKNSSTYPSYCCLLGCKFQKKDEYNPQAYIYLYFGYDGTNGTAENQASVITNVDILYYCESEPLMSFLDDKTLLPLIYKVGMGGIFHIDTYVSPLQTLELYEGYDHLWSTMIAYEGQFEGIEKINDNSVTFSGSGLPHYGEALYMPTLERTTANAITDGKEFSRLIGQRTIPSGDGRTFNKGCLFDNIYVHNSYGQSSDELYKHNQAIYYVRNIPSNADFAILKNFYLPNVSGGHVVLADRYIKGYSDGTKDFWIQVVNIGDEVATGIKECVIELLVHEAGS